MSPASALVTERPLRKPSGAQRTPRERLQSGQQVPRRRSQPEIDAMVTEHLPLASFAVNAVAARISLPSHVSREDLLSCAHVALVEVAKRFDPTAGASFATYALARLQGAVLDELRSGDWASRSVRAAARRTDAAADALTISLGRPPTREELAVSLGVPRSDLDSLQVDVHRAVMISIDAEIGRRRDVPGPPGHRRVPGAGRPAGRAGPLPARGDPGSAGPPGRGRRAQFLR